MVKEYLKKRPKCEEDIYYSMEKCENPAMFVLRTPHDVHLVCGIHARMYQSKALNPFRLKELSEIRKEQEYSNA